MTTGTGTTAASAGQLPAGGIRFYDSCVPALAAGNYVINVTQQVNPVTTPPIDESYEATQHFSVAAPRYALPAQDVSSVFPPPNSSGPFEHSLPHVVFTQRDLPWERNVFGDTDDATRRPWMALLLFVEGEQIDGKPTLLAPQVSGWTPNPQLSASIPTAQLFAHPADAAVVWPELDQQWYEDAASLGTSTTSVIDISAEAFAALLPSGDDVRYLAHARQVDPSAKAVSASEVTSDGWYSVIVGNRLPDAPGDGPPRRNIVHLVSLEGLTSYLAGTAVPTSAERVRLISLLSWAFTCVEAGGSFSELMTGLLVDAQGQRKPTAFALPTTGDEPADQVTAYAARAIGAGYVPLRYQTRQGEQTFAWYRGPFTPTPAADFVTPRASVAGSPEWTPFGTASAAMIYDPTYGLFDASYGVAWETGRLLAMSDASVSQELVDFQQRGHALIDLVIERKHQIVALAGLDAADPDAATESNLLSLLEPYALTTDFTSYLVSEFAGQVLAGTTGTSGAPATAPRYPDLPPPLTTPSTIQELLTEPEVQEAIHTLGGQGLAAIVDWLAQLFLLERVPFETLVPAQSMLPTESVRFFYLDPNWLAALLEGALSIAIESRLDRLYQDLMKGLIWDSVTTVVQQVRDRVLGTLATETPSGGTLPYDDMSLCGMLLRSSAVSGWPGLQVNAFGGLSTGTTDPDPATAIGLLRMNRLSSDILLCLWPTVPAVVTIDEPHEGVAFGFEDPPAGEGYSLYLRSLDPSSYGTLLSGTPPIDATAGLIDSHRCLVVSEPGGLLASLASKLPSKPALGPADVALQMLRTPERATFINQQLEPPPLDGPSEVADSHG